MLTRSSTCRPCRFLGALAVLPFSGQMVDSTGSKPLMRAAIGMFAIVTAGWGLVAANVLPYSTTLVALLNLWRGRGLG